MKYQKELNLSVGLCRHSLATNSQIYATFPIQQNFLFRVKSSLSDP